MAEKNVTKKELVQEIADEKQFDPAMVGQVVQDFLDKITDKLSKGFKLEFRDFGVFKVVKRKAKVGRNPRTKVEVIIAEHYAVKFKAGKIMQDKMKELTKNPPESLN